jgi:hypothetical protein
MEDRPNKKRDRQISNEEIVAEDRSMRAKFIDQLNKYEKNLEEKNISLESFKDHLDESDQRHQELAKSRKSAATALIDQNCLSRIVTLLCFFLFCFVLFFGGCIILYFLFFLFFLSFLLSIYLDANFFIHLYIFIHSSIYIYTYRCTSLLYLHTSIDTCAFTHSKGEIGVSALAALTTGPIDPKTFADSLEKRFQKLDEDGNQVHPES